MNPSMAGSHSRCGGESAPFPEFDLLTIVAGHQKRHDLPVKLQDDMGESPAMELTRVTPDDPHGSCRSRHFIRGRGLQQPERRIISRCRVFERDWFLAQPEQNCTISMIACGIARRGTGSSWTRGIAPYPWRHARTTAAAMYRQTPRNWRRVLGKAIARRRETVPSRNSSRMRSDSAFVKALCMVARSALPRCHLRATRGTTVKVAQHFVVRFHQELLAQKGIGKLTNFTALHAESPFTRVSALLGATGRHLST